jgi:hypothetical protein
MIKESCFICKKELNEPGALLWGVPDENKKCLKTHICAMCYPQLIKELKAIRKQLKDV